MGERVRTTQPANRPPARGFRPAACEKCGGDAFFDRGDESEWRCLQCGRTLLTVAQPAPGLWDAPVKLEAADRQAWIAKQVRRVRMPRETDRKKAS